MNTLYASRVPQKLYNRPARDIQSDETRTSLCANCERATRGHCPWAQEGKPVKGWTAEKTVIRDYRFGGGVESYKVTECPGYVPTWVTVKLVKRNGRYKYVAIRKCLNQPDTWDEDGVVNLLSAMMDAAREDYILIPRERKHITEWVRELKFLDNPDAVLEDWRGMARIYDLHPEKKQQLLMGLSDEEWAERQEKIAHEKMRAYWVTHSSKDRDWAECEHCGREIEIRRSFPRRCPGCNVIMRGQITEAEYEKQQEGSVTAYDAE